MITKDSIEAAYCLFHQKLRVYEHSGMDWQRDDIEFAISSYTEGMNRELYDELANGKEDYLLNHSSFQKDMEDAVSKLGMKIQ
jgi:inorganic pyrophosphatase/exopolyphosphatase